MFCRHEHFECTCVLLETQASQPKIKNKRKPKQQYEKRVTIIKHRLDHISNEISIDLFTYSSLISHRHTIRIYNRMQFAANAYFFFHVRKKWRQ